jgi:hypothetical protein
MPLGNHTSQFFANIYLNELDQFVKHEIKAKYYIRYVDDFVIFGNSPRVLHEYKDRINHFLREKLHLRLHPDKSKVYSLDRGVPFLGYRMFPHHKIPRKANIRKFEVKIKDLKVLYHEKQTDREKIIESLEGWMAYAKHGNTYKYRREILRMFNKTFPIYHKDQIIKSKKSTNFFRKFYASKVEFSVQKTRLLLHKGLTIPEIAQDRKIKEGTVWDHIINLIEYGQISVWNILPKSKIVHLLRIITDSEEPLKQIRERLKTKRITFNEIACVRAHLKMKRKIACDKMERRKK